MGKTMNEEKTRERKPYEKPELRRVTLKAEESLAAGCKTPATSAPAGATCSANSCFNFGS
jgi:hypothetical protein